MLNNIKDFPAGSIRKFDYEFEGDGILCTKCRFDIELVSGNPKFIEYKSWTLSNIPNISSRQMVEYFRSANSIGDIKYIFNKLKTPDIGAVRNQMQTVLSNNADEVYQALRETIKEDLGIEGFSDFIDIINDTNSKLYNFIDIK